MKNERNPGKAWAERIIVALIFLGVGALIILVFSPWRPMIHDRSTDYFSRLGLSVVLLAAVLLAARIPRLEMFRQILTGLFILSVAVSLDLILSRILIASLGLKDTTPAGHAWQKVIEGIIVIGTVLLLNKLAGGSLGSIYVQKGNLKLGLIIGLVTFLLAVAGSFPMATLFKARDLSLARVVPWIPWVLIYVLVNAAMEELMFRGLFLRKLQPFFGKFLANFLVAFVFTALHGTVSYSADNLIFVAVVFPLALGWGYVMQKTDAVWGSILFHAGMDIPIMLGIFSNLS
jgi:membrane protease YdiL (CAAX protease family)